MASDKTIKIRTKEGIDTRAKRCEMKDSYRKKIIGTAIAVNTVIFTASFKQTKHPSPQTCICIRVLLEVM